MLCHFNFYINNDKCENEYTTTLDDAIFNDSNVSGIQNACYEVFENKEYNFDDSEFQIKYNDTNTEAFIDFYWFSSLKKDDNKKQVV